MRPIYEFDAVLHETPDSGGAYVVFPWDLRAEFGQGRVKVRAAFDGIPYDGSIVNMGVKDAQGSICYVIGVRKAIRRTLNKAEGDTLHVVITPREGCTAPSSADRDGSSPDRKDAWNPPDRIIPGQ